MCGKNAKKRKECIHLETCQELNDILALFHELYTIITKLTSSNNPFDQYFEMAGNGSLNVHL